MATRYGSLTLQLKNLSDLSNIGSTYADTLISASGTEHINKAGKGSFTVSARANTLLTAVTSNMGQVAYVYVTDAVASGAAMDVTSFIIHDIKYTTGMNGSMVTVSGPSILHELTFVTLDDDAIDDGAGGPSTTDIADIMVYEPSGWSNTGGNTANGTYHVSSGNNVLEMLIAAAKQSGEMFRLSAISPPAKTVHWLSSADSSGVTLRMPTAPIDYDGSTTVGIILSMTEDNSFEHVVTRIRPFGAGLADGRLDITGIDAGDTGGDPSGYTTTFASNLIVNTTLETSLGYSIKQDVDFSHIRASDVTNSTELTSAAVALWNEGITYLQERDDENKAYSVECVVPYDLRPGQSVTIVYDEYEGGQTGGSAVWSVNSAFTIHSVTTSVGNSSDLAGVRITNLTVGETTTPRATGASTVIGAAKTTRETTRKTKVGTAPGYIPDSRTLTTTQPVRIGGGDSADLSANRTISINGLTTVGTSNYVAGVNNAGNAWEYKNIAAGTGISVGHTANTITITNTDLGSDLDAVPFVTIGNSGTLSAERALTAGDGIDLTDGGANSTVTLAVDVTDILGNGLTESSNNLVLGTPGTITSTSTNAVTATSHTHAIDSTIAPGDAAFLTIGNTGDLSAERAFTAGNGLSATDSGANSTYELYIDLSTNSGLQFDGGADLQMGTPTTLTVATSNSVTTSTHAHEITSSSNPGAAASLLATDASGYLELERLIIPNNRQIRFTGITADSLITLSVSDDLIIQNSSPGAQIQFTVRDSNDAVSPYIELYEYGVTDDAQLRFSSHGYITTLTEGLTLEPAAGSNLEVSLATTGDFIVNTDDLVVDTSASRVGIGIASPDIDLHIHRASAGTISANSSALLALENNGNAYINFLVPNVEERGILLGEAADAAHGGVIYGGSPRVMTLRTGGNVTRVTVYEGVQVGSPTGGDKGAGTINTAADIYKNNSAYTNPDYALEMWRDGQIKQFADNPGAATYHRLTLGEIKAHIVNNLRLPGFSDQPTGIFERGDLVLEKLEEIFTHLIEMDERLEAIGG
jgi:hypothetical protein